MTRTSVYSLGLRALRRDVCGFAVDEAVIERFLRRCLPHAAEDPEVSIQAAALARQRKPGR
jgi:hypothetical protein